MERFLDPEIVKMVRFLDPEISKMVDRSYISASTGSELGTAQPQLVSSVKLSDVDASSISALCCLGRDDFRKKSKNNSALVGLCIGYQNLKGETFFNSYKRRLDPPRAPPVR